MSIKKETKNRVVLNIVILLFLIIINACQNNIGISTHLIKNTRNINDIKFIYKNNPEIIKKIENKDFKGLYISEFESYLNNSPEFITFKRNHLIYKYNFLEKDELKCKLIYTNKIRTITDFKDCE